MRVLNKREVGSPSGSVYIGRPSRYGNPFVIGTHGNREQVIMQYESWARWNLSREDLLALVDKDLVCWCAPQACHGDVLVKLVKEL